jgi:hypothetical protein
MYLETAAPTNILLSRTLGGAAGFIVFAAPFVIRENSEGRRISAADTRIRSVLATPHGLADSYFRRSILLVGATVHDAISIFGWKK